MAEIVLKQSDKRLKSTERPQKMYSKANVVCRKETDNGEAQEWRNSFKTRDSATNAIAQYIIGFDLKEYVILSLINGVNSYWLNTKI